MLAEMCSVRADGKVDNQTTTLEKQGLDDW